MSLNKYWIVLSLLSFIGVSSCRDTDDAEKDKTVATSPTDIEPAYEVTGTYKDTLPCASCPGIAITLIFSADKQVQKTELYLEQDENSRSVSGSWAMESPERIKVVYADETEYYLLQSDKTIRLVGETQQAPDEPDQQYVLHKQSAIKDPLALSGVYSQVMEDGHRQELRLEALSNQTFRVTISSTPQDAASCSFSGQGTFVNNRIEINLASIESSLKGTMTITVSGDTAVLFTAEEAQRYDLMFFCSSGASIAGNYLKQ